MAVAAAQARAVAAIRRNKSSVPSMAHQSSYPNNATSISPDQITTKDVLGHSKTSRRNRTVVLVAIVNIS